MNALTVGLGTTTIEPALTGGRFDGIGVYTGALLRHLGGAGCTVLPYSYPRVGGRGGALRVGRPLARSFEHAILADLFSPPARALRVDADLFHATDYRIVRMACPVVATLHDALPISHPEWCSARLRGLKNRLLQRAVRRADHVIALSRFGATELLTWFGIDERRISVVPNGVDARWFDPVDEHAVATTLARHGLRRGYYLFVGTLQPRKNLERLLDAWQSLPPGLRRARQLVIVGAPGWRCEHLVARLRAARQKGEQVAWLDQVSDDASLQALYAGAGVFVFVSLYEGFGLPLLEAFAAGIPVVASSSSALPEVSAGAAVEVDANNTAEIGDAMRQLAGDDALRTRCIAAGRARARQLGWAEAAEGTAGVYRAVLAH